MSVDGEQQYMMKRFAGVGYLKYGYDFTTDLNDSQVIVCDSFVNAVRALQNYGFSRATTGNPQHVVELVPVKKIEPGTWSEQTWREGEPFFKLKQEGVYAGISDPAYSAQQLYEMVPDEAFNVVRVYKDKKQWIEETL